MSDREHEHVHEHQWLETACIALALLSVGVMLGSTAMALAVKGAASEVVLNRAVVSVPAVSNAHATLVKTGAIVAVAGIAGVGALRSGIDV